MKYKIGVDIDGVLRDFPQDLFRVIKRDYPDWLIKNDSDSFVSIEENWELERSFNATDEEIKQLYRIDAGEEILANGLPYQDNVDYLRKEIKKVTPDIELSQEIEIGGESVKVNIPMTVGFFWPDAEG